LRPLTLTHSYKNGNCLVSLFEDGTKVGEFPDGCSPQVAHPESIDVKITNFCDMGCSYCHETSTMSGRHGDLSRLLATLESLPPGVELAIGGGNPLSHPALVPFLIDLQDRGIVANLTVNQGHLNENFDLLVFLLRSKMVKGLGISVTSNNFRSIEPLIPLSSNIVFHVIAGVNDPEVVVRLNQLSPDAKTLVLGYKTFGKGVAFFTSGSEQISRSIKQWAIKLPELLGSYHMSFDNLAIEQLRLKRLFTDKGWNRFYMGDDGAFTMYVDAVEGTFAKTSRSDARVSFSESDLLGFFKSLHESLVDNCFPLR
jgi:hypothetical protein